MKKNIIWFLPPIVCFIVCFFFISFSRVSGTSMNPNLKNNDIILVNKITKKIERFDVVLIKVEDTVFIKRIIGMPNEEIKYVNNKLYVDDLKINEPFLESNIKTNDFTIYDISSKLEDDKYLVLGDNRNNSIDSRIFGLISSEDIIGKVIFRVLPFKSFGDI